MAAEDALARLQAADMLIELGQKDDQVDEALLELLDAAPKFERIPAWERVRSAGLLMFSEKGHKKVPEALVRWAEGDDVELRIRTANFLHHLKTKDRGLIDLLYGVLDSDYPFFSAWAAEILSRLGKNDEAVATTLLRCLDSGQPGAVWRVQMILEEFASLHSGLFQVLALQLEDEPYAALEGWRKLKSGEPMRPEEGEHLARLVTILPEDDEHRITVKSVLFGMIWKLAEGGAAAKR